MTLFKDFKKFIARGNLMDMAVGIMVGSAFNNFVQSLVKDILTPLVGVFLGRTDVSDWQAVFVLPALGGEESKSTVIVSYGKFMQSGLDFLILAVVIFVIIRMLAQLKSKAEDPKNVEIPTPKDIQLLSEIRDLLKSGRPVN